MERFNPPVNVILAADIVRTLYPSLKTPDQAKD